MSSRWRRGGVVTLSLLGIVLLAACSDVQVVAPTEQGPSTTSSNPAGAVAPGKAGLSSSGLTSTTTTVVVETTDPSTTGPTAPSTTDPTAPSTTDGPYEGAAAESLAFVNQKRAENGLPALAVDPDLTAMAVGWANQIATDRDLRHNPNLGEQAPDQYMSVGENVGYAPSAAAIDNGWWESDGHRENILRSSFQVVGIAFVVDGEGTYWGVQVFAGS